MIAGALSLTIAAIFGIFAYPLLLITGPFLAAILVMLFGPLALTFPTFPWQVQDHIRIMNDDLRYIVDAYHVRFPWFPMDLSQMYLEARQRLNYDFMLMRHHVPWL
jgi:hypothetical protein